MRSRTPRAAGRVAEHVERRSAPRSNRVFDFPRVRVSSEKTDERRAAKELAAWLVQGGFGDVFVVASRHGAALTERVAGIRGAVTPSSRVDQGWVRRLVPQIRASGARAIVAVGGGRTLDAAKLAASTAGVPVVAVPTQLSHDGMCSPVAVLPDHGGVSQSLPAVFPSGVFFSLPTIRNAPERALRAGLGDLLSNPFALRDWELAAVHGEGTIQDEAWHLSLESADLVDPWVSGSAEVDARDPELLTLVAHALVNSGLAMLRAGSSRPASGAEHKISHAVDLMFGGRASHGEQVAFACVLSAALHGLETGPVLRQLDRLGLPSHPRHLDLSAEDLVDVVAAAPATRPGRFTILEQTAPSRRETAALVRSLWGPF